MGRIEACLLSCSHSTHVIFELLPAKVVPLLLVLLLVLSILRAIWQFLLRTIAIVV